jgi:hypothetical protein
MCNKFVNGNGTVINTFSSQTVDNSGWTGRMRVAFIVEKSITKIDEFMNYVGEDCYVLVLLPTPIETPLTAEELAAYKALHTNYPNTTIISETHLDVKYVADTKNYIDNKFKELSTALVALGGV